MKKLFLGIVALSCVSMSQAVWAKDSAQAVGLSVRMTSSPYRGVDSRMMPTPVLRMSYKRFFIDGRSIGSVLWGEQGKGWSLSAVVEPRFMGYSHKDSNFLDGMDDRRMGVDAGVRWARDSSFLDWSLTGVSDISGNSGGMEVRTMISKSFARRFLTPSIGLKWQSRRVVNYYYGVQQQEALLTRPAYEGAGVLDPFAGLRVAVPLGKIL